MNEEVTPQEHEEVAASVRASRAGEQLRAAREGRGLTRDEVAAELRLQVRLIAALEENDRSHLPPAAFISGYVRAYAKLLGLAAEPLIGDFAAEVASPTFYRPTDRSGERMVSSHDPKFRFTTYGVVGLLLVLFGLWWANERFAFVASLQPPAAELASEEVAGAPQLESALALPPQPPEFADPPQEELPSAVPSPEEGTTAAPAGSEAPPVAGAPRPVAPPVVAAAPSATPPAANAGKPASPVAVLTAEPLPVTVAQATLRLEYQAASWTQVEDAKGRVLIYDTINPGRKLELRGVAPFKVFLGYAPGVLLYYNGALYSHAPYHRGDLAKFTVGSAQDNRPLGR